MARCLLSSKPAALAAALGCLASLPGPALASAQEPSCGADGSGCPAAWDELDEASLLVRGAVVKAHDHEAEAPAALPTPKPTCAETLFQGLCYRTCTDLGEMEPRWSPSSCGGTNSWQNIQSCNEDGTSLQGSASAPGLGGRPLGACFESPEGTVAPMPVMCTQDCASGAPSATVEGCWKKWCCSDGKSEPQAAKVDGKVMCTCPLGKKAKLPWLPKPKSLLTTPAKKPCNTVCNKANSWLSVDHVDYCCPGNTKPNVTKTKGSPGDLTVTCTC